MAAETGERTLGCGVEVIVVARPVPPLIIGVSIGLELLAVDKADAFLGQITRLVVVRVRGSSCSLRIDRCSVVFDVSDLLAVQLAQIIAFVALPLPLPFLVRIGKCCHC